MRVGRDAVMGSSGGRRVGAVDEIVHCGLEIDQHEALTKFGARHRARHSHRRLPAAGPSDDKQR